MSNSKNRNAEHNLIFAGLGLQLGIIAKDKVIRAFTEWLFDKTRPLGEILVHQKAITPEQRKTLESAVTAHIQQEGGEQKALASLNHIKDLESDLDHLADNDLNQSLDGAVTQRKLLGLDVLFSQSHDSESSSTNKKGSLSGPEGKQTDRFERQHFLDSGNLGEVFFAKDTELNRTVVTKYIRPEMSGDTFKQALFHLEGEVTGALEHPSVVPVYGLGKDIKGRIYYAMRYIRGKKLSRVIAEYHRKEAGLKQEALTGLLQNFQAVCLAIEYAHSKGVLHCDIKPDNIMIGDFGEVFVVDWGLVVVCGDVKGPSDMHDMETLDPGVIPPYKPSELASSGLHEQQGGSRRAVGGTPAYMAPEQFTATMSEDISLVTPKADIYALGSTLYHILTGKAPHLPKEGVKESPDAFYFRITTGMIPTPREKDASISKLLEQIVLKAMQVEPGDRYASARELAEDIKRYVSDEPVHAYQESGLEKSRRWIRKNRSLVGAAMVMLLLLTMVSIGFSFVKLEHSQELAKRNQELEVSKNEIEGRNQELEISKIKIEGQNHQLAASKVEIEGQNYKLVAINKDAIDAKEKAEKETDRANQQTKFAESEKKKAEAQQDRAESLLYVSKINRAITELESGSINIGLEELISTPFSYRGWEHDFITSNFYKNHVTLTSDSGEVFCYSPDGKKIASSDRFDRGIKILDAETGKELQTLKGHTSSVDSVNFSPDGKKIAIGNSDYIDEERVYEIKILDAETGKELQTLIGHTEKINSVNFSPDGKKLLTSSGERHGNYKDTDANHLKMWDLSTGKELVGFFNKQKGSATTATFSPDGKKIASISEENNDKNKIFSIKIWDAATGKELQTLKEHRSYVTSISYSPDGKKIASGSWDNSIKIWDAETGKKLQTLTGHTSWVTSVSFSPDGKNIASGSWDKIIKIWDAETSEEVQTLKGHTSWVTSVTFSHNGTTITSGASDGIKIWDAKTGKEMKNLKEGYGVEITSVSFSPDGKKIASGGWRGSIKILDAETGKELQTLVGNTEEITSLSFTPDGKKLLSLIPKSTRDINKNLKMWDLTTGKEIAVLNNQKESSDAATFNPDGKKIAKISEEGNDKNKVYGIKIRDAETGKELQTLKGHKKEITNVSFSTDGKKIASTSGGSIKIWDAETGKELQTLKGYTRDNTIVSFSPDGKKIASASGDSIKIWDAETGKEFQTLKGHTEDINSVSFSPDGKRLLSYSGKSYGIDKNKDANHLKMWDLNTGKELVGLFNKQKGFVTAATFSPDGKKIVSAGNDKEITIWTSGDKLDKTLLQGEMSNIVGMEIKNNEIIVRNSEGTIKHWDLKTGVELKEYNSDNELAQGLLRPISRLDSMRQLLRLRSILMARGSPLDENKEPIMSSDKKWFLESDYKNVYLVNNELRAKRIASDKAKLAQWGKMDPVWHLHQANEFEKSKQLSDEIFHLKLLVKINPNDKAIQIRLKKCEDSYSRFLEIQKTIDLAEVAGFALFAPFLETKAKEVQKKVAKSLKNEEKTDLGKGINLEMVLIPAGKFKMGSPKSELGRRTDETQHEVTLTKPYYMGTYEVTQEQWEAVMGDNPSKIKGEKLPVTNISWEDCQEFIKKLNVKTNGRYRLPTEAEWEFACRAGTSTAYSFGDSLTKGDANFSASEDTPKDGLKGSAKAVGGYKPNAFGLYDMHGNVWEWCEDWKTSYLAGAVIDPIELRTGERRVIRGGSFDFNGSAVRSSYRADETPAFPDHNVGFRLARSINSKDLQESDIKEFFLKEIKEQEEKAKKEQEEKAKKEAEVKLKKEAEDAKVKEAQKKAAMLLNKEVEVKAELGKGINLEMVLIPAGKFIMGSPVYEKNHRKEETEHEVTLTKPFYMGKYEVTQEQWEEVMGNNPSKTKGAKLPVTEVSWLNCQEFIKKLNAKTNGCYRLPTEAEWEYACRAGTNTAYSYGDSITKNDANVIWGTSTKIVGSYKPNAFGLYDMHGNVWEWCEDWKADYPKESVIDPKGPATGQYRLLRGGSFTGAGSHSRAANWWGTLPATKENDYLGLRLAKTP
jgi:formylglycine-generating enzyme required for sulfatase activity/WD40 repeat protein